MKSDLKDILAQAWDVSDLTYKMSPKEARDLLSTNTSNRSQRRATIDKVKKDIANGRFRVNGDTIVISNIGTLLNGQHRLQAIAEGTESVDVILVKGVDPAAFATIDNHRPRSLGDYFNVHGAPDYSRVAALVARAERWESGLRGSDVGAGTKRHGEQVYIAFYEKNKDRIHAALRSPARYEYTTASETSLFRYIVGSDRAVECDTFLREVNSGQSAVPGVPVTANVQRVFAALVREKARGDRGHSHRVLGTLIAGWNAKQDGKCCKKTPFEGGSLLPEVK